MVLGNNITEKILKNVSVYSLTKVNDLAENVEEYLKDIASEKYKENVKMAFMYEIGLIEGKRIERKRYKYNGVKKGIIDIIKNLENIKKLNIILGFIKGITGSNNKIIDKSVIEENRIIHLFNQLNEEGRKQALDSMKELTYILKYNEK